MLDLNTKTAIAYFVAGILLTFISFDAFKHLRNSPSLVAIFGFFMAASISAICYGQAFMFLFR